MKTAVITGASSGIGAATASALVGDGYRVVLGARRLERLQALAGELGGEAIALDVTDSKSVNRFVAEVPSCDVLINNAGGPRAQATATEVHRSGGSTKAEGGTR